jgi:Arc/MetJ-type ribon-helix-helix transcriptional regulator
MPFVRVNLTDIELATLQQVMKHGEYRSLSDAIRDGLRALFVQAGVSDEARQQMALERLRHPPRRRRRVPADIDVWTEDGRQAYQAEHPGALEGGVDGPPTREGGLPGGPGEQTEDLRHTN